MRGDLNGFDPLPDFTSGFRGLTGKVLDLIGDNGKFLSGKDRCGLRQLFGHFNIGDDFNMADSLSKVKEEGNIFAREGIIGQMKAVRHTAPGSVP